MMITSLVFDLLKIIVDITETLKVLCTIIDELSRDLSSEIEKARLITTPT